MKDKEEIEYLTGQVSVLGIAIQAILQHHPSRDAVAVTMQQSFENALAKVASTPIPEAFLDGAHHAHDLYLLKSPQDPGQPKRK
jgi:hypothetical protein